jgi:hypothetical protein
VKADPLKAHPLEADLLMMMPAANPPGADLLMMMPAANPPGANPPRADPPGAKNLEAKNPEAELLTSMTKKKKILQLGLSTGALIQTMAVRVARPRPLVPSRRAFRMTTTATAPAKPLLHRAAHLRAAPPPLAALATQPQLDEVYTLIEISSCRVMCACSQHCKVR